MEARVTELSFLPLEESDLQCRLAPGGVADHCDYLPDPESSYDLTKSPSVLACELSHEFFRLARDTERTEALKRLLPYSVMRSESGIAVILPMSIERTATLNSTSVFLAVTPISSGSYEISVTVSQPTEFDLFVYIPSFYRTATIGGRPAIPGDFFRLHRVWFDGITVKCEFEGDSL